MLKHRIIPTLLLKNKKLVKTIKFKNPKYIGDPVNAVRIFNEKEVDELILLDISATLEKREPNYSLIEEVSSEAFMPVSYGGGITSLNQMESLFKLGIEKVIINSALYNNYSLLINASKNFGDQSIVVAIDVKKTLLKGYKLYSISGKKKQNIDLLIHTKKSIGCGCGEIYLNNIDRDGTMSGYDLELIKIVSEFTDVPLIVSGGAGKIEHLAQAIQYGAHSVSAGSLFVYKGVHKAVLINYPDYSELEKLIN